jgi:hypothetical protein
VDRAGYHSALSRNLGLKKAQLEALMAGIPLDKLPTIEEAREQQEASAFEAPRRAHTAEAPLPASHDMSFAERKEQITAIRKPCDHAQAFRNALEEAGYVLAKGYKRREVLHFNVTDHTPRQPGRLSRLSRPSPSTTFHAICCGIETAFMAAPFGRVWLRCQSRKSSRRPAAPGRIHMPSGSSHFIILNARHLKRTLASYFSYYHGSRTHLGLDQQMPVSPAGLRCRADCSNLPTWRATPPL